LRQATLELTRAGKLILEQRKKEESDVEHRPQRSSRSSTRRISGT
jgi:hypothetical protein